MSLSYESDDAPPRRAPTKTALVKLMDLLARRGHSEFELRQKLGRNYPEGEVEAALAHAREQRWLAAPEDLRDAFVESLDRRLKSAAYIDEALRTRGLPPRPFVLEIEIEKAFKIAQTKIVGHDREFDETACAEVLLRLGRLGFTDEAIEQVLSLLTPTSRNER